MTLPLIPQRASTGRIISSTNSRAITEIAALTFQGRAVLQSRWLTAREALRKRQTQMAVDRESRYRKEVGTHLIDRLAYEIVVRNYPQGRRYALDRCLQIRRDIAAAKRALDAWDAETEAAVTTAESQWSARRHELPVAAE